MCRAKVPANVGKCAAKSDVSQEFRKGSGRYVAVCASSMCQEKAGFVADAAKPDAGAVRALTVEGDRAVVTMPFDRAALPLLRSLPGAKFDGSRKVWTASLDIGDRPRLIELAQRLGLDIVPELTVYDMSDEESEAAERAKAAGAYPYQIEGIKFLVRRKRTLLADDMGLGKTMQALIALPATGRALVVAPKCVLHNWAAEVRKWRPDLTPIVADAVREPRDGEVVIVNYAKVRKCLTTESVVVRGKQKKVKTYTGPDMTGCTLVCDEAHRVKNYKAQVHIGVKGMAESADRVLFLTGTPLLNRPLDLWGVLQGGGMALDVFGSWGRFVRAFNGYKGRFGYEWGAPEAHVSESLRRVMIRRLKTEVLRDLPPKTYTDLHCEVNPHLCREMDTMWAKYGDALLCGEMPDFEEMAGLRAMLAKSRIDQMCDYVADCEEQDQPLLVFSAHKAPVEALKNREGWAVITGDTPSKERQEIVDAFQEGELKGVAGTIGAMGVGLTLTRASTVLFVDLDWTPALNAQAEDRVCRIGQRANKINIVRMVSDHDLDTHILDLLSEKQALITQAIESQVAYNPGTEDTTVVETEEEWQARMDLIRKAAERAESAVRAKRARRRISDAVHRIVGGGRMLTFTDAQKEAMKEGVSILSTMCDGAYMKDGVGFNKADTGRGKWLAAVGGPCSDEDYMLAYDMLRKYKSQIPAHCAVIYGEG